jgi:hypothetical protein
MTGVIGAQQVLPLGNIHIDSIEMNGSNLVTAGAGMLTAASATWPTANRGIFTYFAIQTPVTITQLFCYNGATVSGNVDMGIYDAGGRRIVSIGSTAQAGVNQLQLFDITDTTLFPDLYLLALSCDNTTATFFRTQIGATFRALGAAVTGAATVFPLPASMSPGVVNADYIPLMGLTTKTVV